jgi:hypothetical protein
MELLKPETYSDYNLDESTIKSPVTAKGKQMLEELRAMPSVPQSKQLEDMNLKYKAFDRLSRPCKLLSGVKTMV